MRQMRALRFFILFILPNAVFAALGLVLSPEVLTPILNGAMLAVAAGVCVAYFPILREVLLVYHRKLDRADILGIGIFYSSFAIIGRAIWSLAWRYYGKPPGWVDSHFIGYFIFMSGCGACLYLLAPGAVNQRIPSREWLWVGALTAAGVASTLLASWLLDAFPLAAR